jgi:hypothetical protein
VKQQGAAGAPAPAATTAGYLLQGSLLEACSCNVLCPCWVGQDPDGGACTSFLAYHFDNGVVRGVDVSGLEFVIVAKIPGNVLVPKSWKIGIFIDERATDEQMNALLDAYSGKLGGPLADIAQLIGEVLGVERVPISHTVRDGKGTLAVGGYVNAEMEPFRGPDGTVTTLRDSIFSTIPGSPAYVGKVTRHRVDIPKYAMQWEFAEKNAIQGDYLMTHSP